MSLKLISVSVLASALAVTTLAFAADDPIDARKELMEGVRDAAKPVGGMLRGEQDYDAGQVTTSLTTFKEAAAKFGDLFPEGTESGSGTEAAPAIWEDRDGFNEVLMAWADATDAALAAAPQTLDEARPVLGAVFKNCKGCHDNYRIEDEE